MKYVASYLALVVAGCTLFAGCSSSKKDKNIDPLNGIGARPTMPVAVRAEDGSVTLGKCLPMQIGATRLAGGEAVSAPSDFTIDLAFQLTSPQDMAVGVYSDEACGTPISQATITKGNGLTPSYVKVYVKSVAAGSTTLVSSANHVDFLFKLVFK